MPQILKRETANGGLVVVWKMEESVDELLNILALNEQDLKKVDAYKLEVRKLEFLTVRHVIKNVIGKNPMIEYLDSGKPILKNSNYTISISHTKGYVAVAFSLGNNAGIDIEYPSERVANIYKRFVSEKESKFIPADRKIEYYTLLWCLKESMYKIYDRQNSIFNINFQCHPFELNEEGEILATFNFETSETMKFHYITSKEYFLVFNC